MPSALKLMAGPHVLAFWWLALATQLNLNHFFNLVVGTGWFINIGILFGCVFLLLAVRVPLRRSLGAAGYLYVATMISYFAIGLYAAVVTGADWRTDYRNFSFYIGLSILLAVAAALAATAALRRIGVEKLLAGILAIQTASCIAIILTPVLVDNFYAAIGEYRHIAARRAIGTSANPNQAAALACQAFVLALAFVSSRRYRKVAMPAAAVAAAAAYLTRSRTAIVMLVVIGVFFLLFRSSFKIRGRTRAYAVLTAVLVVGAIGVVRMTAPAISVDARPLGRFTFARDLSLDTVYSMPRFRIWPVAVSFIAESPIIGNGLTQFLELPGAGFQCNDGLDLRSQACGSHNMYLMFLGESGIAPLILSLSFTGLLLGMHLKAPRSVATDAGAGWVIILALQSMAADGTFLLPGNAFLIGLACAMAEYSMRGVPAADGRAGPVGGARRRTRLGSSSRRPRAVDVRQNAPRPHWK